MTRQEVRELCGLLGDQRCIEVHIHEVEDVERTDPTYLSDTVLIFLGLTGSVLQIVVTILDVEVETGVDRPDHGVGTSPVGGVHLFGLRIVPDPPSLIGCQLIAVPDGTVEAGRTCIDILYVGVLTRTGLTDDSHTGVAFGEHSILVKGSRRVRVNRCGIQILHTCSHCQNDTR